MRIAQVAPLYESVPPKLYGGTERVVSYLTEELVKMGHEVTLFASGDSRTNAKLVPITKRALRLDKHCVDPIPHHVLMLEKILQSAHRFDIIHFHVDLLHFPVARRLNVPTLTTLHGRLDIPDLQNLYREFSELPFVSISNAQRKPLEWINWQGTVYHGLPTDLYHYHPKKGEYLAFIGRISPEKRPDRAIMLAKMTGLPLKIAAKVDKADREYFETVIKPMLNDPLVEFIGEIGENEKDEFLGNALALVFLIDWPEPFGLVMIEALACGTPVIAYGCGSVPEIIEHNKTGFIVNSMDEAVKAVENIDRISRRNCRRTFEMRFSAKRMAQDYLNIYRKLIDQSTSEKLKAV